MKTPITIEDYYNLRFLQGVDVSSTGKLAYILASYKKKGETPEGELLARNYEEQSHLWVLDETHRQLSSTGYEQAPGWSPNGTKLVYSSVKDGKPQLYLLNMKGGEPRKLTSFENGVGAKVSWLSETEIVFAAGRDEKLPEVSDPYSVTRDVFRVDGVGLVQRTLHDIYMLDLDTDELTQLTETSMHHMGAELSPDGTRAIVPTLFEENDPTGFFPRPFLFDLGTKDLTKLSNLAIDAVTWVDDQRIAFIGFNLEASARSMAHIYLLNLDSNELQNLTENDFYGATGDLEGDMPTMGARMKRILYHQNHLYFPVQIGGNIEIRRISLEDNSIETIVANDANYLLDIKDNMLYFTRSTLHNPLDIYQLNLENGDEKALSHFNQEFLADKRLPEVRELKFKGTDGEGVEGWLMLPKGTAPFPTLLRIHGGPHGGWGNIFQFEALYLLAAGYAILLVNHRGSTGYGEKFSSMITGDWGNLDYHDLMAGVDQAIDMELVDKDNLGCFGISGGGNLSCWIVGQTDRFKASIPENPVTNMNTMYSVSDVGRWFARIEMGGLPWEIPDVYRKSSPITYAHKCTTPTLLIQHEGDLRCPPEQSDQFYAVLKEVGCDVEMLRMPGTPHAGSLIGPLVTREKQNRAILEWFQKYIPIE